MTITYSLNVSEARLCGFAKLLFRWRGSIYKLLYREMVIFCGLYYSLSCLYRYILSGSQRTVYEKLTIYCETFTNLIPLSFVLGFYVSIVVGRWWQQYMCIPWPDKPCMLVGAYVHGNDERGRVIRRTLARYLSLMSLLTFQAISTAIKKRFPTLDHIEEAGLMTKEERLAFDALPLTHGKWWVPAQWFTAVAARARKEGRIKDDILLKHILDELHTFRGNCGMLFAYDWISIPLVYTQVVTLAIYTYFLATVMGRQYLDPEKGYPGHEVDLYIPIFTLLQFFFYMGWLKVAEQLINPFGEDDDDFELNWCLDRNLQVSFLIVDEMHNQHPKLVRDNYWDELEPTLPYTKSSLGFRSQPHLGSAVNLNVEPEEAEFLPMETIMEEDNEFNTYNSVPGSPVASEFINGDFITFKAGSKGNINNEGDGNEKSGFLSDFSGSKLINMILGSNHDSDANMKKESNGILPSFVLRTPNRKSQTTSISESLNQLSEGGGTFNFLRRNSKHDSHVGAERASLIDVMIDTPSNMPTSNKDDSYPHMTSEVTKPTQTYESPSKKRVSQESIPDSFNSESESSEIHDTFSENDPVLKINNAQDSLSSLLDSNQSTVSSFAELLQHEG